MDGILMGVFDPNASRNRVLDEIKAIDDWVKKEVKSLFIEKTGVW
jgi:hypothetical protein